MIVVATEDFELYHDAVAELQDRGVTFTTVEPSEDPPEEADIVLTGPDDDLSIPPAIDVVRAESGDARSAVEDVIALLRGEGGRTIIGIDPGEQPGIAVLAGDMIVATFQVPPKAVAEVVHDEAEGETNPLVRVGDGARLIGAQIIDDIDGLPVELVDESGTTPYLGTGTRGVADVLAAANIARLEGERVDERDVEPTRGELKRIQERSRELSEENRTIDGDLARAVAVGELTVREALDTHRKE